VAKLYKITEIERIHNTRIAVPGRIYEDVNRVKYVGTKNKRLDIQKALSGDATGTTLGSSVDFIAGVSSTELIKRIEIIEETLPEKVDETEFEEYKKQAKCFAVAMSIAL